MRRSRPLALLAFAATLAACAHVEPPPGGPEDKRPPALSRVEPDSLAVLPGFDRPVHFLFDERLSERGVERAVSVSPRTSPPRVDHGGGRISVSLREGWLPGLIYHVVVGTAVQDLFGNSLEAPVSVVFSTGPEIPATRLRVEARDRVSGARAPDLRVDAVRLADSLVYLVPRDTAGGYTLARFPEGDYLVRAFEDTDSDRRPGEFEKQDAATVSVTAGDSTRVSLSVVLPDTTPARITRVRVDGRTLRVEFDDHLDPAQVLTPGLVRIRDARGRFVPVSEVAIGDLPAADTAAAARPAPRDTARAEPLPARHVEARLADEAELMPEAEYRIEITRVTNIVGLTAGTDTTFTTPAAAPPPAPPGEGAEAPHAGEATDPPPPDSASTGVAPPAARVSSRRAGPRRSRDRVNSRTHRNHHG